MPQGFELWMTAGCFGLALAAFAVGAAVRLGRPSQPPTLPLGPGIGGWRVAEGVFMPVDLAVAAVLVGFYAVLPLVAAGAGVTPAETEIGVAVLVANAAVQVFLMAMVIGVIAWRRSPVEWLGLRWRIRSPLLTGVLLLAGGVVATMATGYLVYGLEAVGYQKWLLGQLGHADEKEAVQDVVKAFSDADNPGVLVMLCLTAVVVAPVTEEVIFRGYLYPLAKRFSGRWAALAFSSLLFAMVHQNAMALLPLAFLALLLALAYEATGSIWAPIGIHMFFNASTVFAQIAQLYGWIDLQQG